MGAAVVFLNLARLRRQPLRVCLTVAAVAAGVTLFVAVVLAQASVEGALGQFDHQRAGPATLEVVGGSRPGGLDDAILPQVEAVAGVAAAVPLVQTPAIGRDSAGGDTMIVALGVDCRTEAIVGDIDCDRSTLRTTPWLAPSLQESLGPHGAVRTDQGRVPTGEARTLDRLEGINHGRVVVFALDEAQRLFTRPDSFDRILVVPEAEDGTNTGELTDSLAAALGDHVQVRPIAGSTQAFIPQLPLLFLVSLVALAIGGQLARHAVMLALEERRGDLAVAAALGGSPASLLVGTTVEMALLGLAGGLLGVAGGVAAARPLVSELGDIAARLTGVGVELAVPARAVVLGVLLGVLVAALATVRPAWRVIRGDVAASLRPVGVTLVTPTPARPGRAGAYLFLALTAGVVAWLAQRDGALDAWQPPAVQASAVLVALLLGAATFHAAAPLLAVSSRRIPALRRGVAGVAVDDLTGDPSRTGTMTLAVVAAVALGIVLGSIHRAMPVAVAEEAARQAGDAVYVSSQLSFANLDVAGRSPPGTSRLLAKVPGVAAVTEEYVVVLDHPSLGGEPVVAIARHGPQLGRFQVYRGDRPEMVLGRGEVLVGPALARDLDLGVGDAVEVPGRNAIRSLRVGAIWADSWLGGRNISLPYRDFRQIWGRHAVASHLVASRPGVSAEATADHISDQLERHDPDLTAQPPEARVEDIAREVRPLLRPFWALQRSLLAVVLVAALAILLLAAVRRRREQGLLIAVGLPPRSLGRMATIQAGLVGLLGSLLGAGVGVALAVVLSFASPVVVGYGGPLVVDFGAVLVYGLLAGVCGLLGAALPAWRAARMDPAAALRYE